MWLQRALSNPLINPSDAIQDSQRCQLGRTTTVMSGFATLFIYFDDLFIYIFLFFFLHKLKVWAVTVNLFGPSLHRYWEALDWDDLLFQEHY